MYLKANHDTYIEMNCAPGTTFALETCGCGERMKNAPDNCTYPKICVNTARQFREFILKDRVTVLLEFTNSIGTLKMVVTLKISESAIFYAFVFLLYYLFFI